MPAAEINLLAVLFATVLAVVIGYLWYHPSLFGKDWVKETGLKEKDVEKGPGKNVYLMVLAVFVQAYVLAHFVDYTNSLTWLDGAITGVWLWLGFTAAALASNYVFARKSLRLWSIDAGYFLVVLILNGALLAVWR